MPCTKTESTPDVLILSLPRLPANVQALQGSVWAMLTSVTAGRSACGLSATLDRGGSWRKMFRGCCQLTLDGSSKEYSVNWPKWGMMLDGEYMEPLTSGHRTKGIDCALWPTVTINDHHNRQGISKKAGDGLSTEVNNWATPNTMDSLPSRSFEAMKRQATNGGRKNRSHPGNLREQIDPLMCLAYKEAQAEANNWATPNAGNCGMTSTTTGRPIEKSTHLQTQVYISENWPTPKSSDATRGSCPSEAQRHTPNLESVVKQWATPQARDTHGVSGYKNQQCLCNQTVRNWSTPNAADAKGTNGGGQDSSFRTDVHGSGGQLNPDWVETLMGYPVGWTNPDNVQKFDYFKKRGIWEVFNQLWPARRGEAQHGWEPPRTVRGMKGRPARIKMLGNAVVPQWAFFPLAIIAEMGGLDG